MAGTYPFELVMMERNVLYVSTAGDREIIITAETKYIAEVTDGVAFSQESKTCNICNAPQKGTPVLVFHYVFLTFNDSLIEVIK